MNIIRSHAQDFIQCTNGIWKFVDDSFIEILRSINIVELTTINSQLRLTMEMREARVASVKEFVDVLFARPEGPHYLTSSEWATTQGYGASSLMGSRS